MPLFTLLYFGLVLDTHTLLLMPHEFARFFVTRTWLIPIRILESTVLIIYFVRLTLCHISFGAVILSLPPVYERNIEIFLVHVAFDVVTSKRLFALFPCYLEFLAFCYNLGTHFGDKALLTTAIAAVTGYSHVRALGT